jgi:hypothetical protein
MKYTFYIFFMRVPFQIWQGMRQSRVATFPSLFSQAETLDLLGMAHDISGNAVGAVIQYGRAIELFRALEDSRGLGCQGLGVLGAAPC